MVVIDEREIRRARNSARRIFYFTARDQCNFDSDKREHQQDNAVTHRLAAGPTAPAEIWRVNKKKSGADKQKQRQQFRERDDRDRACAFAHAENVDRY